VFSTGRNGTSIGTRLGTFTDPSRCRPRTHNVVKIQPSPLIGRGTRLRKVIGLGPFFALPLTPAALRFAAYGLGIIVFLLSVSVPAGANGADHWAALRSGDAVALLRHALAPGGGDPENFEIGDCSTQRNLSAEGHAQARRIGDKFRANGIAEAQIHTSQWCRCVDTATGMGLGSVANLPILNSFFRKFDRRDAQTAQLKSWIATRDRNRPQILVTHQVNITALTGVFPASGELIVVRLNESKTVEVIGRERID